jgi:hypothetical protein
MLPTKASYLTDVLAGIVCGLDGYCVAVHLEASTVSRCETAFECHLGYWQQTLTAGAIFLWILQVATELRHVVWITEDYPGHEKIAFDGVDRDK